MKTLSKTALLFATALSGAAITAPTVSAQDSDWELSANAALVSDYRFRGISLSDKDIAIQGGFDAAHSSGFYVGTWASSIDTFAGSETELDVYAGYATTVGELDFDIGLLAYTYPGSSGTTYWEAYTSVGGAVDAFGWTLGAAYAFDQDNLGDQDNIYLYADASYDVADTPVSLTGHIAYEDGAFGDGKWDWNAGASYSFDKFSLGIQYVDTNVDGLGSAGVVVTLGASF